MGCEVVTSDCVCVCPSAFRSGPAFKSDRTISVLGMSLFNQLLDNSLIRIPANIAFRRKSYYFINSVSLKKQLN